MPAIPSAPPAITISFAPQAVSAQQGTQETQSLNLRPYEIVQATVVEGGMDTVELELGRYRLKAHTRVPLRTGQRLQMQVQNTSPHVELKILHQALLENLFQRLHLFGEKLDLTSRLQQILGQAPADATGLLQGSHSAAESLLQDLSRFTEKPDGNLLAALHGLLGLDTEARLASESGGRADNLKAFLLHLLGGQDPGQAGQQEGSARLLQHTELLQLCQARLQQNGVFFLPLPFPFLERGFALMERRGGTSPEGEEDRETEEYSLSLCLRLRHLGAVEVRMLYEEPQLLVRILCEEQRAADFFTGLKGELKEAVEALPVHSLTVTTGGRDPDRILMEKVLPESEHFVERTV